MFVVFSVTCWCFCFSDNRIIIGNTTVLVFVILFFASRRSGARDEVRGVAERSPRGGDARSLRETRRVEPSRTETKCAEPSRGE